MDDAKVDVKLWKAITWSLLEMQRILIAQFVAYNIDIKHVQYNNEW